MTIRGSNSGRLYCDFKKAPPDQLFPSAKLGLGLGQHRLYEDRMGIGWRTYYGLCSGLGSRLTKLRRRFRVRKVGIWDTWGTWGTLGG